MTENALKFPTRTHQAAEALEGSRDPDVGIDFDEHSARGVDVDLQ